MARPRQGPSAAGDPPLASWRAAVTRDYAEKVLEKEVDADAKELLAFMGWFGPRGIASIALLFVVISEEHGLPGLATIETTVVATVLLSIIVHGVSAPSLVARYARYVRTQGLA